MPHTLQRCTRGTECKLPEDFRPFTHNDVEQSQSILRVKAKIQSPEKFFGSDVPLWAPAAPIHMPTLSSTVSFRSARARLTGGSPAGRRLVESAAKGGAYGKKLHLDRVLHELKLLPPCRRSGGSDRRKVRPFSHAGP